MKKECVEKGGKNELRQVFDERKREGEGGRERGRGWKRERERVEGMRVKRRGLDENCVACWVESEIGLISF